MRLLCKLGLHEWDGCECKQCDKKRDVEHDWSKNCEKCAKCGAARRDVHKWDRCQCKQCGKRRDVEHDWSKNCEKCAKCGATRRDTHKWDAGKCTICGRKQPSDHYAMTLNDMSVELHRMSSERRSHIAYLWTSGPVNSIDKVSDLYRYGVSSFRDGDQNENWGRLRTMAILWGENIVRKFGWEWFDFTPKGEDEPFWAIFSKDRQDLIVFELLTADAVAGKVPSRILNTLHEQIENGKPLARSTGVLLLP